MSTDVTLSCDMVRDCPNDVSHIGEKGYVYCAGHVGRRSGVERCRKITRAEMATLLSGQPIARY